VLPAVAVVWSTPLERGYDHAIATAALRVLHALERTQRVAGVRFDGPYAFVTRPPGAELPEQRLELGTHHNNVPLLVALMLVATEASWAKRIQRLVAALALLALTHVAHFVLAVHLEYALANVGTYHVDDLNVLSQPLWQRVRNLAELRKTIVVTAYRFHAHVGRLLLPVLLWMLFAGPKRLLARTTAAVAPAAPATQSLLDPLVGHERSQ
jgi:hypothetical protein